MFLADNNIVLDSFDYQNEILVIDECEYIDYLYQIDKVISDQMIINISQISQLKNFIPLFYACLATDNGLECLYLFKKYKSLIAPFEVNIEQQSQVVKISIQTKPGLKSLPRFAAINELLLINDLLNQSSSIKPVEIGCTASNCQPIEQLLKIKPVTNKVNYLVYKQTDLEQAFVSERNLMTEQIIAKLDIELNDLMLEQDILKLVTSQLIDTLPNGNYSLQQISQNLLVSERTVQRKLKNQGLSYNKVLNDLRKSLIEVYFRLELSSDEIAILLGYSDTSSFVRAFKSLMGITISEYKQSRIIN